LVVTTVFRNNRTQAVRLPKSVALPDNVRQVEIRVVGNSRLVSPVGSSWDDWFEAFQPVSESFAVERGSIQDREQWWS
jgi:antitoxin VapB